MSADGRKLDYKVVKGIDKVRRQREKIVKYYVKNNKYGFTASDEEIMLNKVNRPEAKARGLSVRKKADEPKPTRKTPNIDKGGKSMFDDVQMKKKEKIDYNNVKCRYRDKETVVTNILLPKLLGRMRKVPNADLNPNKTKYNSKNVTAAQVKKMVLEL